jgi:hypothetical protein
MSIIHQQKSATNETEIKEEETMKGPISMPIILQRNTSTNINNKRLLK